MRPTASGRRVAQDASRAHEQSHLSQVRAGALDLAGRRVPRPRANDRRAAAWPGSPRWRRSRRPRPARRRSSASNDGSAVRRTAAARSSSVTDRPRRRPPRWRSRSSACRGRPRPCGSAACSPRPRARARRPPRGRAATAECTSVVAPPMSRTATSCGADSREDLDPGEHQVGRGAPHHRGEVRSALSCLPPITCSRKTARMACAGRVGRQHPDPRHHVLRHDHRADRPAATTSARASRLPATTTGPPSRSPPAGPRAASTPSSSPPSVPPVSSTTSGRVVRARSS